MESDATEFLARVDRDLADMVARDKGLAAQEEATRQERVELRARITKLRRLRDEYTAYMEIDLRATTYQALLVPGELAYGPMGTVANLAYRAIVAHGGQMRVTAVLAELIHLGKLNGSHADYATVYRALSRDPRVEHVAPGEFRLVVPPDQVAAAEPDGEPGSQS